MGSYLSRNRGEVEELNIPSNTAYRYPPKQGNYFASHFIMGGSKFETMQPEAYLFGENSDLNFLGPKPYSCPYQVSSPSQPVRALRCLVNIRKDSLRLVKVPSHVNKTITNEADTVGTDRQITAEEGEGEGPFSYNIEFTFDADCPCSITIYYNATEEMYNKNVIYSPHPARECSDTAHFNAGCNQQFCIPDHSVDPGKLAVAEVDWTKGYTKIPIVIQVCAESGPSVVGHCHITYAEFYKPSDTTWSIRTIKQKQAIDGVCYLLQEIYGIENKNAVRGNDEDDDADSDDDSSECVVCLSETRDTLILPCKHLCLCSSCANQLRYQQSGCPICRQSFRALLQIRAVRKKAPNTGGSSAVLNNGVDPESESPNDAQGEDDEEAEIVVPVPEGYEVVPLIEAIKGSIGPKKQTDCRPNASVSTDNITLVDETEPVCSGISSRSISLKKVVESDDSESDDDGMENVVVVAERKPSSTSDPPVKNILKSSQEEHDDRNTENESEPHIYEQIDAKDSDDATPVADEHDQGKESSEEDQLPLPEATSNEESADSTKELLNEQTDEQSESRNSNLTPDRKKEVIVFEETI